MEEPEEVLEQEIAVSKLNAELDRDSNKSLELLFLFIFELVKLLKVDLDFFLGFIPLSVHEGLCLVESL